jgi:hypothetical protein
VFNWFFKRLEKLGRKYVMLNRQGDIIVEKYVLLGGRSKAGLRRPTLCLHHWIYVQGDAFPHTHIGNFTTLVLKGGYLERLDDGTLRCNLRGDVRRTHHTKYHDIVSTEPNTWTLFYMGRFRAPFLVKREGGAKYHKNMWHKVDADLHRRMARLQSR